LNTRLLCFALLCFALFALSLLCFVLHGMVGQPHFGSQRAQAVATSEGEQEQCPLNNVWKLLQSMPVR